MTKARRDDIRCPAAPRSRNRLSLGIRPARPAPATGFRHIRPGGTAHLRLCRCAVVESLYIFALACIPHNSAAIANSAFVTHIARASRPTLGDLIVMLAA